MKVLIFFCAIYFFLLQNTSAQNDFPKITEDIYQSKRQEVTADSIDFLIGCSATDFQFPDINGDSILLSDFKGKVVFLNFFYVFCGPCLHEMSFLEKIAKIYADKVVFICISAQDSKELVLSALSKYGGELSKNAIIIPAFDSNLKGEKVSQESSQTLKLIYRDYKVRSMPTSFLIDQKGVIRKTFNGYDKRYDHFDFYTEAINQLLREKE
jgi:thiol-disulfide isomerase/thioredoxin